MQMSVSTGVNDMQACKEEPKPVQEAYSTLLNRPGGDQNTPDVRAPLLRIRVLKSLHSVLLARRDWIEQQRSHMLQQDFKQLQRREVCVRAACDDAMFLRAGSSWQLCKM